MFALEISFQDGVSQSETIFIRRPQAIIGASDTAHVVIEDMAALDYYLQITRELGRKFRCRPISTSSHPVSSTLEGVYNGQATFDLGPVKFHVTALDSDLLIRENEPPDRAGVRSLRLACSSPTPEFPAVLVQGSTPMVLSFLAGQPLYIGKAKYCALRLDAHDISAKHARIGYESGEFWLEDLGSSSGTFVQGAQISGRTSVPPGVPILLGRETTIYGVVDDIQLLSALKPGAENVPLAANDRHYPILVSVSEVARPAKLVLPLGSSVSVGRDPSSDMWLGAPHVSRKHCSIGLSKTGNVTVTDHSTNGTGYDNGMLLKRGDTLEIESDPKVLDFGGGVTVALCFNEEEESAFVASHGSPHVFVDQAPVEAQGAKASAWEGGPVAKLKGPEHRRMRFSKKDLLGQLKGIYRSLSGAGKMLFIATFVALMVVIVIVANLALPVFV